MFRSQSSFFTAAVGFGLAVVPAARVVAQTTPDATWTGGSTTSNNWNDNSNWSGGLKPLGNAATTIRFAGSTRLTPNNDYSDYTQFNRIFFQSGASSFTLNGAVIKLSGETGAPAKIENNSSVLQTVNFNSGGAGVVFNGGGQLDPTVGDLTVNANVYVDFGGNLDVYGNSGHTLRLNGGLFNGNAATSLVVNDNTVVEMAGASTYTGGTSLLAGKLVAVNTSGSATGSGAVSISSGATLAGYQTGGTGGSVSGPVTVNGTITAGSGSNTSDTIGTLTTAAETWAGGGSYAFNIASTAGATTLGTQTANAGVNWDKLVMSTLSVTATSGNRFTIKIIVPAGQTFTTGAKFEIANISSGSGLTPTDLTDLFTLSTAGTGLASGDFTLSAETASGIGESGTDLFLSYTGGTIVSAPEPTSAILVGLSAATLVGSRRGRRPMN